MQNIKTHQDFTQVCVWPAVTVGDDEKQEFVSWFREEFDVRVQFLEIILTKPNVWDKDTGGRSDVFFGLHKDDVSKFALKRLKMGIRWIEDVLAGCNYTDPIYPERVFDYKTWEA